MPLIAQLARRRRLLLLGFFWAAVAWQPFQPTYAQVVPGGFIVQNVGGVAIDAQGVLSNPEVDARAELDALRREALGGISGDLARPSDLRKVSLRRLDAAIARHVAKDKAPGDDLLLLAGLQRIRYVFVYPELNDIVLAGPAEGWTIDAEGNHVGQSSGMPVLYLDDLIVALRTMQADVSANTRTGIGCSIDPTPEGRRRLEAFMAENRAGISPELVAGMERSLGPQAITVHGVPATSHFARVMVAADYRMKRLAMNLDPSPVRGMTSYLHLMSGRGPSAPRWWLEPDYDPLLKDEAGLVWELRGGSVRTLAEEDAFARDGSREQTRRASPVVQRWANMMTEHYDALTAQAAIFGQLRNCMELAVVAALVFNENLPEKAGCSMSTLFDEAKLGTSEFPAPRHVASQASVMRKGRNWIVATSGGVHLSPWSIVQQAETESSLADAQQSAAPHDAEHWWWD